MTFTKVGTYKGPIFSVQNVSSGQNKVSTWLFYYFTLFVGSSFFVCICMCMRKDSMLILCHLWKWPLNIGFLIFLADNFCYCMFEEECFPFTHIQKTTFSVHYTKKTQLNRTIINWKTFSFNLQRFFLYELKFYRLCFNIQEDIILPLST